MKKKPPQLIPRPDLLDERSPQGMEIFQITSAPDLPACHISMEGQVFTPDSAQFLLHEGIIVQSGDHKDPRHRILLCDCASGELQPVTDETGVTAPSMAPDGSVFYYFVDESEAGTGRVILRRRRRDGSEPETLAVLDGPLPGTHFRASLPYGLSTISSDGRSLAISFFLGDGVSSGGSYGLVVFDLTDGSHRLLLLGPSWRNIHAQFSRSTDPVQRRNIMIQENHDLIVHPDGSTSAGSPGLGADIHVVRDDGQDFRNLPWARMDEERCVGHQCWRGQSEWAIGGIITGPRQQLLEKRSPLHLMESRAVPHSGHAGAVTPGGERNCLTRDLPSSHFNHFATDRSGRLLISDFRECWDPAVPMDDAIYLLELGAHGSSAAVRAQYLCSSGSSWLASAHVHPFLSPDGRTALFNSDESGQPQAYLVRNLPF